MSTSDQIRQLHNDGKTVKEIASLLNIRYQHAYGVINKIGDGQKPAKPSTTSTKKDKLPIDDQTIEFLRQTSFPSWWSLVRLEDNRWSAHCKKKLFPHHTQAWYGLEAVIEEATMIVKDAECKCM